MQGHRFDQWQRAMAPHSSTLAWKIPWTEEPGGLQSMGSLRVGHDWATDFPFTFHFHALEKEMATHSSVLAWRIPGTGEPGGLPSMGSHWVGHDWSDLAAAVEFWDTSSPKDHLALMYPDIRQVFHTSEETQCPLSLRTPLLSSSINSTPFFFSFERFRASVNTSWLH